MSATKGVTWANMMNVWIVNWVEMGRPRTRWFRAQVQGMKKAKYRAETFRRMLESVGRVDNRRTERHVRMQNLAKKAERRLRKKRFSMISKGLW